MAVIKVVDPITRIEGHLKVTLEIDNAVNGTVTNASLTGNMFRGFENFLVGREPLDAALITQRVCGVCPTAHGLAAVLAMDDAANVQATPKGTLMRNIIHGAEYFHSHILHSYHLALLDYIDMSIASGGSALNKGPWAPTYGGDRRIGGADLERLVGNYIAALAMRRKAHSVGAILAGKQPHAASLVGGGCTATPSAADIAQMRSFVQELKDFTTDVYAPDMQMVFNTYYSDYFSLGVGCGQLLSYGAFRQGTGSTGNLLIKRGIYDGSNVQAEMDQGRIVEDISKSWYTGSEGLHPSIGQTNHDPSKVGGYSWLKAPRYKTDGVNKEVYEVGPLARMVVGGDYPAQISVGDRELARTVEALKVLNSMLGWLDELEADPTGPSFIACDTKPDTSGIGLTEAVRGALGHWVGYDANGKVAHYQIVTPTCWNSSPMDSNGVQGTMEQALIGTPIQDADQPIEALRVIHSYDPCLACAVHVIGDDGKTIKKCIIE
jgi:hydrogenase large subunit